MIEVYSCHEGLYFFKVSFASGLKIETNRVKFLVRRRCRPLPAPPNTVLSEVKVSNSDDYKVTVTCRDKDAHETNDLEFMDEEKRVVLCDTTTGTYNTTYLTPCLRVIEPM